LRQQDREIGELSKILAAKLQEKFRKAESISRLEKILKIIKNTKVKKIVKDTIKILNK
jgi:hypothetical protein